MLCESTRTRQDLSPGLLDKRSQTPSHIIDVMCQINIERIAIKANKAKYALVLCADGVQRLSGMTSMIRVGSTQGEALTIAVRRAMARSLLSHPPPAINDEQLRGDISTWTARSELAGITTQLRIQSTVQNILFALG